MVVSVKIVVVIVYSIAPPLGTACCNGLLLQPIQNDNIMDVELERYYEGCYQAFR